MDQKDFDDFGLRKIKSYSYIIVVIVAFSKFERTAPFKNKNSQFLEDSFEIIPNGSENQIYFELMMEMNL